MVSCNKDTGIVPHNSVAIGVFTVKDWPQLNVCELDTPVRVGAVWSRILILCVHNARLPQASVAE